MIYPKVVGFVPAYKSEHFIHKTLEALALQTYPNFEIWICDDASPDGTAEVCKEFCRKDTRFKFFQNESNLGWWKTWTSCWEKCAKESVYSFFHPHDDLPFPDFIATQVELLEKNPQAVLCVPGIKNSYTNRKSESLLLTGFCSAEKASDRINQLVSWEAPGWWAAVHGVHRSALIPNVNPVPYLRFGEKEFALDLIWLIRLAAYGPFIATDQILFEKFYSDQTLSGSWKYNFKNRSAVYFAMAEEVSKLPIPIAEKAKILQAIAKKSLESIFRKVGLAK